MSTLSRDFPTHELTFQTLATRQENFAQVVAQYHAGMKVCPTELMLSYFVSWLEDATQECPEALTLLPSIWTQYEAAMTPTLYLKRIDFQLRRYGVDQALEQAVLALDRFANCQDLYLCWIELIIRKDESRDTIDRAFRQGVKACATEENTDRLWQRYTEWVIASFPSLDWVHERLGTSPLRLPYLRFCFEFCEMDKTRQVYRSWLAQPHAITYELLTVCLAMEVTSLSSKSNAACVELLERLVDFDPSDPTGWQKYIAYYESNQDFKNANAVRWRAQQHTDEAVLM